MDVTLFITAIPSFREGVARVVDIGAVYDDLVGLPPDLDPDAVALALDWAAVGADLRRVVDSSGDGEHRSGAASSR